MWSINRWDMTEDRILITQWSCYRYLVGYTEMFGCLNTIRHVSAMSKVEKRHKIQGKMHGRHHTGAGSSMKEVLAAWRQLELLEFLNGRLRRGG